jgi:hypothetical protein
VPPSIATARFAADRARILPELIYSTVASHDRPNATPPRVDLYEADRLDWVVRDAALDRFDVMPPDWPL